MRRRTARLAALLTSLALVVAVFDGCLLDCHGDRPGASRASAASHCHATDSKEGTAWQSTATCDHQHDLSWSEGSVSRSDSAAGTTPTATTTDVPGIADASAHASSALANAPSSAQPAPAAFIVPLRV
jgi:hypothetical protein